MGTGFVCENPGLEGSSCYGKKRMTYLLAGRQYYLVIRSPQDLEEFRVRRVLLHQVASGVRWPSVEGAVVDIGRC